jgi:transcriptional regulator with AAA-type ATPase domain
MIACCPFPFSNRYAGDRRFDGALGARLIAGRQIGALLDESSARRADAGGAERALVRPRTGLATVRARSADARGQSSWPSDQAATWHPAADLARRRARSALASPPSTVHARTAYAVPLLSVPPAELPARSTVKDDPEPATQTGRPRPGVVAIFSGAAMCRSWPLDGALVVGRSRPAHALLADDRASREHAEIAFRDGSFTVRDLGSSNGTFVAGRPVTAATVDDGAIVRVGHSLLLLLADARAFLDAGPHIEVRDRMVVGPVLRDAIARVRQAGATGDPLLVTGESGSGKELMAREYHAASRRADGPFVAVNSGAIPEALAERLLFGAVKGAFSGATSDARGYLEEADGGTLFLDEVGELPALVQTKLLRVLETREVVPVGGTRPRPISFGLVAATNREVRAEVELGRFRADLYYRLGHLRVSLPSLRERAAEVPWIVQEELRALDARLTAHPRLVEACCHRDWPGNIRELRSEVRRAGLEALRSASASVTTGHLAESAGTAYAPPAEPADATPGPEPTRPAIEAALAAARGNVTAAARALGIHRSKLYRLLERLEIRLRTDEG